MLGWNFSCQPLREAVAKSIADNFADWSVEPVERRGAGLGGALKIVVE